MATVGILMLETRFERPPGDIGNPASFAFPVRYRVVPGASAARVVGGRAEGLVPAFIEAGHALVAEGCRVITTSCGFMALHQPALARALPVPVAASALMLLPLIEATGLRAGVLTASAGALGPDHLRAVGARPDTAIEGLDPAGRLAAALLGEAALDPAAAEAETVAAARRLAARPGIGAIVFECTNLPPYAAAVRRATGLPVWSVLDLVRLLHAGWAG